jgi:hypothetical protein
MKLRQLALGAAAMAALVFTGCSTPAYTATQNVKLAADNFQLNRRIVFYNSHTDSYMMTITGRASVNTTSGGRLEVTVKTGPGSFKVHYLGLSRDVTYFSEQLDAVQVDDYRSQIIFRPESVLPAISVDVR